MVELLDTRLSFLCLSAVKSFEVEYSRLHGLPVKGRFVENRLDQFQEHQPHSISLKAIKDAGFIVRCLSFCEVPVGLPSDLFILGCNGLESMYTQYMCGPFEAISKEIRQKSEQ